MKRILILTLTLTLLTAGLAMAQLHERGRFGGPPEPGAHMDRLAERLDLSDAQRESLEKAFAEHRDAMEPAKEQLEQAREALEQAVLAETLDEAAIRGAAGTLATLMADQAVARAEFTQTLRGFLSPEQVEQLVSMRERFKGPGPRHHGPHGPGNRRGF